MKEWSLVLLTVHSTHLGLTLLKSVVLSKMLMLSVKVRLGPVFIHLVDNTLAIVWGLLLPICICVLSLFFISHFFLPLFIILLSFPVLSLILPFLSSSPPPPLSLSLSLALSLSLSPSLLLSPSFSLPDNDTTLRNATCHDRDLRVSGGMTVREGRVEVCFNQAWGTICDGAYGDNSAGILCRQLGFRRK